MEELGAFHRDTAWVDDADAYPTMESRSVMALRRRMGRPTILVLTMVASPLRLLRFVVLEQRAKGDKEGRRQIIH